ncbi:MAG: hypothetical protein ABEJ67_05325 [Halanaeroarchaeum sp.]
MRDVTLDAFGDDGDGDPDAGESGEGTIDAGDDGDESPATLRPTTEWHPEGRPCDSCGATVERRWRQEDAMVCPDCKDWTVG